MPPFLHDRIIREPYVNRLSRHILTAWRRFRYSTVLLTTAPLRCGSTVFLHVQDGLLAEEDEKLPLAWHVVGTLQHFHLVEDFIFVVFVWAQEVVVSDPESQVIVSPVDVVKAVCVTVRSLIGSVKPLDHLFKRAVFRRDGIIIGKSDDLGDLEGKVFAELFCEFHGGKRIGAVAVSDELKFFRQLRKATEGHTHGEDTGADAAVVGYLVADDGPGCCVHNEPDIGFDTPDFYIGFIGSKYLPFFVGVLVNKGLNADGGSFAVVGNLLVGNVNVVQVFQGLRGFSQGEAEVDVEGQAQGHNVGIMFAEFQG